MDNNKWTLIKSIVNNALSIDPAKRATHIDRACDGDEELINEVKDYLDYISKSEEEGFLNSLQADQKDFVGDLGRIINHTTRYDDLVGKEIGRFKITKLLNQGGMGVVYKGERADGTFQQKVAVKIIKSEISNDHINRRFRQEREILAKLTHPNIAQIYDGGISDSGIPYLVMEFVDGDPIDVWCDKNRCTIKERMNLFGKVCRAIQFAHQHLIVHRDIKPQNIFVTKNGQIKILDFGIAKMLEPIHPEQTLMETGAGSRLWTPKFAAPEQITGKNISLATDIYALGALLYTLLSGFTPYDFRDKSTYSAETEIVNNDPVLPSKKVLDADEELVRNRGMKNAKQLYRLIQGDIEAIIMKAMRRNPVFRYATVNDLSNDINNYKANLPVQARVGSFQYRTLKFWKRHNAVIIAAVIIVGLTLGYFYQVGVQRDKAQLQAKRALAIKGFMIDIFGSASPNEKDPSASDLLRQGAISVQQKLKNQPILLIEMLITIGRVQLERGLIDDAAHSLNAALNLQKQTKHIDNDQYALLLSDLGMVAYEQGDMNKSVKLLTEARELTSQKEYLANLDLYDIPIRLADMLVIADKPEKARLIIEPVIQKMEGNKLSKSHQYIYALTVLGGANQSLDNLEEAELALKKAMAIQMEVDSSDVFVSLIQNELGILYWTTGEIDQAADVLKQSYEMKLRIYGPVHPQTETALSNLSAVQLAQGDYTSAISSFKQSLRVLHKIHQQPHPSMAYNLGMTAWAYFLKGNNQQAKANINEGYKLATTLSDLDSPFIDWVSPFKGFLSFTNSEQTTYPLLMNSKLDCSLLEEGSSMTRYMCIARILIKTDQIKNCATISIPTLSAESLKKLKPAWQTAYWLIRYRCKNYIPKEETATNINLRLLNQQTENVPAWLARRL